MPLENSLPIVLALLTLSVVCLFAWLRTTARAWLVTGTLAALVAVGMFVADRIVVTDREHLEALLPRLAAAAERHDIDTIIAALDPELRPLRDDAERVLRQVRPTDVTITKLAVTIDSAETATADLIVRVTGDVVDKGTAGTVLAGMRVSLAKRAGQWLIRDAEVEPVKPGR